MTTNEGIFFDAGEIELVFRFVESLTLTKSTKSGGPERFRLLQCHKKLIANLLGWKRPDGSRVYRKCYFSTARKNAKTQCAAVIALIALIDPREQSPEIYAAAKDRDKASFIFRSARDMVRASEELSDLLVVIPSAKMIRNRSNNGVFRALSSEGKTKHGSNPSVVLLDEFHVWGPAEEDLYKALTTGSAARRQPLTIILTTAGNDEYSMCRREYDYAKGVLAGTIEDPTYLPLIYEIPQDANWSDESLWPLANPTLGDVVQVSALREEATKARLVVSEQSAFRQFHCNQWTNAKSQWIALRAWDACKDPNFDLLGLRRSPCMAGLDLASVADLTAFVLAWPIGEKVYVYPYFWIPAEGLAGRSKRDNVPYSLWVEQGFVELTPGAVTDWRFVTRRILALAKEFNIRQIGYDRYSARDTVGELDAEGLTVVDISQNFLGMSGPSKRLEELVLSRRLVHNGHPVLRWNIDCCSVISDGAGNIRPDKPPRHKSSKRIDGVEAMIMAIDRCMRQPAPTQSVYETRGLLSVSIR